MTPNDASAGMAGGVRVAAVATPEDEEPDDAPVAPQVPDESEDDAGVVVVAVGVLAGRVRAARSRSVAAEPGASTAIAPASPTSAATLAPAAACRARWAGWTRFRRGGGLGASHAPCGRGERFDRTIVGTRRKSTRRAGARGG